MTPILRPVVIVIAIILTAIAGSVAAGNWETFQLWRRRTSFGMRTVIGAVPPLMLKAEANPGGAYELRPVLLYNPDPRRAG